MESLPDKLLTGLLPPQPGGRRHVETHRLLRCSSAALDCRPACGTSGDGGGIWEQVAASAWHGQRRRWRRPAFSICPLENSPEWLETITAPAEEIAITISDGKEGSVSTAGAEPDL